MSIAYLNLSRFCSNGRTWKRISDKKNYQKQLIHNFPKLKLTIGLKNLKLKIWKNCYKNQSAIIQLDETPFTLCVPTLHRPAVSLICTLYKTDSFRNPPSSSFGLILISIYFSLWHYLDNSAYGLSRSSPSHRIRIKLIQIFGKLCKRFEIDSFRGELCRRAPWLSIPKKVWKTAAVLSCI